jgi:hypothetical protein
MEAGRIFIERSDARGEDLGYWHYAEGRVGVEAPGKSAFLGNGRSAVDHMSCAESIARQNAFPLPLQTKRKTFVEIRRVEMCSMNLRPRSPLLGYLPVDQRG